MRRGFTLIETLMVIALTAMMAGLGAVVSFTFLRSQRLESTAETIAAEMTRARADAFDQVDDAPHGIEILSDRVVRFEGASYATRTTSKDLTTLFPSSVTLSGMNEIDFASGSLGPVVAGTTTIADGSQSYLVTISAYGVIDITKGAD